MYQVQGKNNVYEVVIGCEIHAQIATNSKLFSRSAIAFGASPNSQVSLVDVAFPGMLPTINIEAVYQTVKTGLGIGAKINSVSVFDRKNYFYPDLPQGYQISQYLHPLVGEGELEIAFQNEKKELVKKTIGIERIHLEQDAGKSIHDQHPQLSLIDLNRSGIALMEIVSKPHLSSPQEASEYVRTVRSLLRCLKTSDADMEKGNLRCDANVSVRVVGSKILGTRCEIKNLNSMRNIARAIEFEAKRQVQLLESGQQIKQETRLFDAVNGETRALRSKEDAMDYRYFPDPDLPKLVLEQAIIDEIKQNLPELPWLKKARYIKQYNISEYDAGVLTAEEEISQYFEQLIAHHEPKLCVSWLTVELFGRMNKLNIDFANLNLPASHLIELLSLIKSGEISGKIAKDVLDTMLETNKKASIIVQEKGLKQVSDSSALIAIIKKVIINNQDNFAKCVAGDQKLFGFFIGQIMKETKGQANPQLINKLLQEEINSTKKPK
ncbi:MAG: Asp-tRNA(Asn)/Glu-tRNA(Gln) amidotransferase GatCAB subunit B [Proteobacteria bacterium]|nr:Asp-tRNA(Asn)/Glu-tRNA(Gln) amidotransferase GatCAB subunit B [Pseudomonadota bacterium]